MNAGAAMFDDEASEDGDDEMEIEMEPEAEEVAPPKAHSKGQTDYLVHNSNNYAGQKTFNNFVFCFPFLFPYGRGGYDEYRQVRMSEKAWFMRCLRIHGNCFQSHYGFIAMGFDSIATSLAYNAQYIAMRFSKRAVEVGILNKDSVQLCLKYQKDIQSCKSRGMKVRLFITFAIFVSIYYYILLLI
jgi:hypothetical protein